MTKLLKLSQQSIQLSYLATYRSGLQQEVITYYTTSQRSAPLMSTSMQLQH